MSTYTAEDFKRAEFARHPDGRIAARVKNARHPSSPWTDMNGHVTDEGMAFEAWIPVQKGRHLTADDITDEMVQRGAQAGPRAGVRYLRPHEVREVLIAALTEKPRPKGAVELANAMEDYSRDGLLEENGLDGLADHLAAMGYRKEQS